MLEHQGTKQELKISNHFQENLVTQKENINNHKHIF